MAVLVFLAFIALLIVIASSRATLDLTAEQYAGLHRLRVDGGILRLIRNHLERNRWYRKTGAWVGFLLATAYVLAGPPRWTFPVLPLPHILAGSLIGMALAEAYRIRDLPIRYRSADLHPRAISDYRDRRARHALDVLLAVVLALGAAAIGLGRRHGSDPRNEVVLYVGVGAAAVVFEHVLARRIVSRGQPAGDGDLVAADDQLRATALESIRQASLGLLWCMIFLVGAALVRSTETKSYVSMSSWPGPPLARLTEWMDRDGTVHRAARPPGIANRDPWWRVPLSVGGVPVVIAAFSCWRRASRVAFDKAVAPR